MTNRAPLIAAILLLFLPVSYVASYFALVVPESDRMHSGREDPPCYYVGGVYAEIFYWPMHRSGRGTSTEKLAVGASWSKAH